VGRKHSEGRSKRAGNLRNHKQSLSIKALLEGDKVAGPASLIEEYPRIEEAINPE
jgi:hypothetical protein